MRGNGCRVQAMLTYRDSSSVITLEALDIPVTYVDVLYQEIQDRMSYIKKKTRSKKRKELEDDE